MAVCEQDAMPRERDEFLVLHARARPVAVARDAVDGDAREPCESVCIGREVARVKPDRYAFCRGVREHGLDRAHAAVAVAYDSDFHRLIPPARYSCSFMTMRRSAAPRWLMRIFSPMTSSAIERPMQASG